MSQAELRDFEVEACASKSDVAERFAAAGVVVVRDLIPYEKIERLRAAFLAMIGAVLQRRQVALDPETDLDSAYVRLASVDEDAALAMRGLGKDLLEYHDLLVDPALTRMVRYAGGMEHFQINYDQCLFRIDRPSEDRFNFDWHQDYPYNLLSRSAVTVWAPLTPVSHSMGSMRIVPGSHGKLHQVVMEGNLAEERFAKHATIRLADLERLAPGFEEAGVDVVDINPRDAVLMHSHLLHRSGPNRSNQCRWVFNPRYGDLLDDDMVARRWTTARARSPFIVDKIHPNLVVTGS